MGREEQIGGSDRDTESRREIHIICNMGRNTRADSPDVRS